ncbi:hypothetical protein [Candidatus Lokiarchaeum ossiferum]|uniref:hypothetical protein n=1 Tax=Candidatus Lokiarchaeum ossiferum TaxID=2951803 RepID=UPI00352F51E1
MEQTQAQTEKTALNEAELEEINTKLDEIFTFILKDEKDADKFKEHLESLINMKGTLSLNYNSLEDLPMKTIQKLVSIDGICVYKEQMRFKKFAKKCLQFIL